MRCEKFNAKCVADLLAVHYIAELQYRVTVKSKILSCVVDNILLTLYMLRACCLKVFFSLYERSMIYYDPFESKEWKEAINTFVMWPMFLNKKNKLMYILIIWPKLRQMFKKLSFWCICNTARHFLLLFANDADVNSHKHGLLQYVQNLIFCKT